MKKFESCKVLKRAYLGRPAAENTFYDLQKVQKLQKVRILVLC